jgi:hypothetical protein
MNQRLRLMQRQPRRITITLSYHVHEALLARSDEEGRSVSNLCAFLLEDALRHSSGTLLSNPTPTGVDSSHLVRNFSGVSGNGNHRRH